MKKALWGIFLVLLGTLIFGAFALAEDAAPNVVLEATPQIVAAGEKITFKYQAENFESFDAPYVKWEVYEWKNGESELVDYALPWFSASGEPMLGTDGKETHTVQGTGVEAVTIKAILDDYKTFICGRTVIVFIGEAPKAIEGLVYSGEPQTLIRPGKVSRGKIRYAVTSGKTAPSYEQFGEELPAGTQAGDYYVWYMVEDEEYINNARTCVKVTIAKNTSSVKELSASGGIYRLNHKKKTAAFVRPEDPDAGSLTIPATVKLAGKSYKVTEIAANACKGMKKLAKVTIGKNVAGIGKNAFNGCKKLKTLTIKTTKLTSGSVGNNAFKGIYKKASIKCPSKKLTDYQKLLVEKGAPKTCKFTK